MPEIAPAGPLDTGWQYARVTDLSGGLYTQLADTVIQDSFTPHARGVVFHSGVAETDDGFDLVDLSTDIDGNEVEGTIQLIIEVNLALGEAAQLILTTATLYIRTFEGLSKVPFVVPPVLANWTTGIETWEEVTNSWGVYSTRGSSIPESIPITWTTKRSQPWSRASDPWNTGIALNGVPDVTPDWTLLVSAAQVVFTNGVDLPFYYDGEVVRWIHGLAPSVPADFVETVHALYSFAARVVTSWNNLLIFLDTTEQERLDEQAIRRRYRVRRSGAGAPAQWMGGIAGKTDLLDLPHNIAGAEPLGQYLIVYREASLIRAEWLGTASQTISFDTVVITDGPLSHRAIAQIDGTHVFVARSGAYVYRGDLFTHTYFYPR